MERRERNGYMVLAASLAVVIAAGASGLLLESRGAAGPAVIMTIVGTILLAGLTGGAAVFGLCCTGD